MQNNHTTEIIAAAEQAPPQKKEQPTWRVFLRAGYGIITAFAILLFAATACLPMFQICGDSMTPLLNEDDFVLAAKTNHLQRGDIAVFTYNHKILVKRIIGEPGDTVNITEDGSVFINDTPLNERYLTEKAFGDCDIALPCQVGQNEYFVIGDQRSTSVDSRNAAMGCIAEEQITGKLVFCIWPLTDMGRIK